MARIISFIENEMPEKDELLKKLYPKTGRSYILGVTGSPGAGKSSLVDRLVSEIRKRKETIGIIAVDPTSPFTGGAILGDRIRMNEHALDKGVFIRSMGTRGSLGGLAKTTKEVAKVMDAFGMDWIIIETVGVGQAELDIMYIADTTVVVLTPGAGDSIQTMKAGIMEIADVFAVNKSDMPGSDGVAAEIELMLDLQDDHIKWRPPVVKTSTLNKGEGIGELLVAVEKHRSYLIEKGIFLERRKERAKSEALDIVNYQWQRLVRQQLNLPGRVNQLLEKVASREMDPYSAAALILEWIIADSGLKKNN
ncbi:MAG: methylmalonyl Co-A mutase-associated GTPase MeaB [Pelotomaculum sp.]|uniref:Putative periplasmic protein kinase ArgK and related GTPase of G3E family n=1 Tax=Pelotomaculum thermopropionicum (strain DSM 13744 / JCM 10971 / SI) TaxID=370438 RepID=A5D2B8_PELTS|nr:methylmalonyl Co-A mutase-associated GTPase MeaB [Pelotomaculum sp.]BAF59597.1 putative periplasmic protein kinase ArgK and related GTPase of G3E family [Pelotomaculum thermopropionicum SI]